jgi:hypothetical protein
LVIFTQLIGQVAATAKNSGQSDREHQKTTGATVWLATDIPFESRLEV